MIYLSGCPSVIKRKGLLGRRKDLGIMLTPNGNQYTGQLLETVLMAGPWAADSGCFSDPHGFSLDGYLAWLAAYRCGAPRCLFAPAPDVVADPVKTWERSEPVLPLIRQLGFAAALVAQDGIESMHIPWQSFDALFIGGSTQWKLSRAAFGLIQEAKRRNKWTHVGRVNTRGRLRMAAAAGAGSVDGTYLRFGPDTNLPKLTAWLDELHRQPFLVTWVR